VHKQVLRPTKQRLMAQIGATNPQLYCPSVIGSERASFKFGDYRLAWNGQRTQRQ